MEPMTESKNLLECAYYWEKKTPDRVYFTQPMGGGDTNVKTWTWKEAIGEARRMATYIRTLNLPDRSHIALCSKNCAQRIMADLAIWMAGHISIPIYPVLTADIVQYLLEHSESKLLFVGKLDPVWEEMKKGVPTNLPLVAFPLAPPNDHEQWDDIITKYEPIADPVERSPDEMATIIYTSGSTGNPKGAMICFGAMLQSAKGVSNYLKTYADDRMLSYLPLAHAMERYVVESQSIYVIFPLFFAENIDTFLQDLRRAQPTLFISVPRLWLKFQLGVFQKMPQKKLNQLLRIPILKNIIKKKILKGIGLNQVRFAGTASAPIPKEIVEWYRNIGLELLEAYGMTENFCYSHCTKPGEVRPGYVGSPYLGVEQRLTKDGEILVKSPGNMMGYFKMPEKTKEAFTGRAKELFKTSKGQYVAPAPIENLISSHPLVEACSVSGAGYPQPYGLVMLSDEARGAFNQGEKSAIEKELTEHFNFINSQLAAWP